jgi:hypothetical protein
MAATATAELNPVREKVSQNPAVGAQAEALALIDDLERKEWTWGIWEGVSRSELAQSLRERVLNPNAISQGNADLCGPAAFAYILASQFPVTYVRTVIDLFVAGRAILAVPPYNGVVIEPGFFLKRYNFRADGSTTNAADWILMASIRDSDNWLLPYAHRIQEVEAITTPHTMAKWLRALGYQRVIDGTTLVEGCSVANLEESGRLWQDGWKVFLLVHSALFFYDEWNDRHHFPNHWIVLRSPVEVGVGGKIVDGSDCFVKFRCHHWGMDTWIGAVEHVSVPRFEKFYWGYLAAAY